MELTQLKFFLEVAKTQHITKSAEKLHISQPSLTQSIHRLEQELQVPLFVHKGRNIYLSGGGQYLYDRLLPIINELDRLPIDLKNMAKFASETIKLRVLAVSTLVTEAIIKYKKEKKELNFQLLQNTEASNCDLEISTTVAMKKEDLIDTDEKKVFGCREKIFLAVPNNEKFQNKTKIHMKEVMEEGFICLAGSKQFRNVCDRFCRHIGFKPHIIFESDNPGAVINMIGANIGVGFYPQFSWGKIKSKHVKLLEIMDAPFHRDIMVTANLNRINKEHLLDFYNFLVKYIGLHLLNSEK